MKKLLILVCLGFLIVGVSHFKKEKTVIEVPKKQVEEEIGDVLVLKQEEIMSWIENQQESIALEFKENQIDAQIELTQDLFEKLPIKTSIKEALMLFENENLACRFLFENKQFIVENCNIKGISIPDSLYQKEVEKLNESLVEWMEEYGIDEIKICDESVRILGDISNLLKKDFFK